MSTRATGRYEVKTWDEKAYHEVAGLPRLTRASVTESFQGDIEGEGTAEYLMIYRDDGSASYVRVERVIGRIAGRSGSFVLQGSGSYDQSTRTAECTWFVVPGSGTGDLRGLRGAGGFVAKHADYPNVPITLDYTFE
ncbi:MAG TPA: DUF3224 domain-containing protein [Terriglobia bacterium]|nr:DUF3224 domain-containing protein [Terriglobia bacterium]